MLFKSTSEMFNPQVHTEELSLTSHMNKDFAVHKKTLSRFERFNKITSFLMHTGRMDGGTQAGWITTPNASQEVHDNAYRVRFKSINIKPAYAMGGAYVGGWFDEGNPRPDMTAVTTVTYTNGKNSGNTVTDTLVSFPIKHDPENDIFGNKFNPQDAVALNGGLGSNLWIQRIRQSSTGDHFIIDAKVVGTAAEWSEDSFDEDEVWMEAGNYVGEGSLKGYARENSEYWKIYYSITSRYSLAFTGHSLDQRKVIWCSPASRVDAMKGAKDENNKWVYEKEWEGDNYFAIQLELACRFSKSSMDPSTHKWFENSGKNLLSSLGMNPEAGLLPPRMGDGWISQIKDTIDLTYDVNVGPSTYLIESVCNVLANNSPNGATGNKFIVVGDAIGYDGWDKQMKKLLGWGVAGGAAVSGIHNTNIVQNVSNGQAVKLGFHVESYYYKQNEFIFMQDELFSHPGLNGRSGGLVGTGNLYIINVTEFDGVSNFELFTRGLGRFFMKSYVDGMHSLRNGGQSSVYSANGFDGAFVHWLADLFPVCYVDDTCAVIKGQGKYSGGALAGNAALANFPKISY